MAYAADSTLYSLFATSNVNSRVLVVVATLLVGCTSTRYFDANGAGSEADMARFAINERGAWDAAVVTLASGDRLAARALHMAPDLTSWIDPTDGGARQAPTRDVVTVRFTRHGRGLVEGIVVGAANGAAFGAAFGLLQSLPEQGALLGAIVFAPPVAAIGGVIGLMRGSRTVYCHRSEERWPYSTPPCPKGSGLGITLIPSPIRSW